MRRIVLRNFDVPGNWEALSAWVDGTKKELFSYLSELLFSDNSVSTQIITSKGCLIKCLKQKDSILLLYIVMICVNHAMAEGHRCIIIHKVDTDVVVMDISGF